MKKQETQKQLDTVISFRVSKRNKLLIEEYCKQKKITKSDLFRQLAKNCKSNNVKQ